MDTKKVEVVKDTELSVDTISEYPLAYSHFDAYSETFEEVPDQESAKLKISSGSGKCGNFRYWTFCLGSILAFLFSALLFNLFFPYPSHASCTTKWKFEDTCTNVMQKFRYNILVMSRCNERAPFHGTCLYKLKKITSGENNVIKATLQKGNSNTLARIKIKFEGTNNTCDALAESVSNQWLMVFDYGANYCNLHKLVAATAFYKHPRFREITSDAICTQYTTAICAQI